MISSEEIKRLSTRYQTTALVIAREYTQHSFLSEFYRLKKSEKVLFKGGTALRIIYQSPRFSEDLDFTAESQVSYRVIEDLIADTLMNLKYWGFNVEIEEAKKTSGGYLAKIIFLFLNYQPTIKIEISQRKISQKLKKDFSRIKNEYIEDYDVYHLSAEEIFNGKIVALLSRSKARDWYDVYFLLKNNFLNIQQKQKLQDIGLKLEKSQINFHKELKLLLPRSHQFVLKDFKKRLQQEIKRYLV